MLKFLKRLFKSDSPYQQFDQAKRNAAKASAEDYSRKRDEEMRLEREKWEINNELAKKRDAGNLHLKKTAYDSYEQYQASKQRLGLNSLAAYANMQAQMNCSQSGLAQLGGLQQSNIGRNIFG